MVDTIKQALTTREIRRKLEWMVGIIFLTRVISMFPIPGVDVSVFKQWMATHSNDALNLFSTFTGGSFENFSVFALGITPLITAQIIIQLLTGVIPSLSKLQKKGEHGNKVMRAITDISAIVLAAVQSCLMAIGFEKSGMISSNHMILSVAIVTISMTAGTGIMIWLSDVLTKRSIGNGVSILLMTNIVSGLPGELNSLFKELTSNKTKPIAVTSVIAAVIIITIMIVVIVY
ncbi:preprotein translocase subunit SecY, partial [Frisingicoccus sp.]|uniref:preprotein translocase subunit SecY n=1 Tax=Frisingicoccus sp. TaxID=1918627 RepID=UPI0039998ADC